MLLPSHAHNMPDEQITWLIVAGGRDYQDLMYFDMKLSNLIQNGELVYEYVAILSGGARGADTMAIQWAEKYGCTYKVEMARWDDLEAPGAVIRTRADGSSYNVIAGFQRNQKMAEMAGGLLAFPGGKGTADMVTRMTLMGKPIWRA